MERVYAKYVDQIAAAVASFMINALPRRR